MYLHLQYLCIELRTPPAVWGNSCCFYYFALRSSTDSLLSPQCSGGREILKQKRRPPITANWDPISDLLHLHIDRSVSQSVSHASDAWSRKCASQHIQFCFFFSCSSVSLKAYTLHTKKNRGLFCSLWLMALFSLFFSDLGVFLGLHTAWFNCFYFSTHKKIYINILYDI